ncbi:MAG TPA: hypothetical protein VFC61_04865 [Blastocatellia bacterium]|nr:hypothetical protein [Blastocatellia bacterium]
MGRGKAGEKKRPGARAAAFFRFSFSLPLLLCCWLQAGCGRRDPGAELQAARAAADAKLRSCLPEAEAEAGLRLALGAVTREPEATIVRLVAYTVDEAADFDLPLYLLSRGRWLINEQGRAYLLDAQCREYKLKDRRATPGPRTPERGRVRLRPGEAFEATLVFPRLPDAAREGALVYGRRVIRFSLPAE